MRSLVSEIDISENGMALDALKQVGPGQHFLGSEHTQSNFETAFWRSSIADYTTYEQWSSIGSQEAESRARARAKQMLDTYQEPEIDMAINDELRAFIETRKETLPDSDY